MGRKHTKSEIPQNNRQESTRDIWSAYHVPVPRAFGIRRPLERGTSNIILQRMLILQEDGDIPASVELRRSMHVTLLPQRLFEGQAARGLVAGLSLASMNHRLEKKSDGMYEEKVGADLNGVSVYKAKIINVKLLSPELEAEREGIAEVLGSLGLRGVQRYNQENQLHVSLGESKKKLSITEQRHVEHVVEGAMSDIAHEILDAAASTADEDVEPLSQPLQFTEWDVYPDPRRLMH